MKKLQSITQKYLGIVSLISFLLLAVFAIGMATPAANCVTYSPDESITKFYSNFQGSNDAILILAIAGLLISGSFTLFRSGKRKIYYIGNFITTGLLIAILIGSAAYGIVAIAKYQSSYMALPFAEMNEYWSSHGSSKSISANTPVFGLGYAICALLLVVCVFAIFLFATKLLERISYEKTRQETPIQEA